MLGTEDYQEKEDVGGKNFRRGSFSESSTVGSFESLSSTLPIGDTSSGTSTTKTTHKNRSMTRYIGVRSKSSSPYRTTAHFGFHAAGYTYPNHFHVPKTNSRFKSLRRSISLEEIFSTKRYLDAGEDMWHNIVSAKFFMEKVLAAKPTSHQDSTSESITLQVDLALPNNLIDLAVISEESSSSNRTVDDLSLGRAINAASEPKQVPPNTFIERITKMAYSSESTAPIQVDEGSITTSFKSLQVDKSSGPVVGSEEHVHCGNAVMGRDERDCRKKEFFELWDNHVESLMAQEQNVSLEYEAQKLDMTNDLIAQEKALLVQLKGVHEDLKVRKDALSAMNHDLDEQEKLLLDKIFDGNLSKDESSIFYRIEQSILNKDRAQSRCMSVESTGTQTGSISTSTPNYSSSDHNSTRKNGDKSRIPVRSPKPRVLFEQNENIVKVPINCGGAKCKVTKKVPVVASPQVRTNASAIFSVYKPSPTPPAKENINVFQKKTHPSPSLWVTIPTKAQKRIAQSPMTPKTIKKPTRECANVTLRKKASRLVVSDLDSSIQENRINTVREMDLETERLRDTIERCTDVISDIGQSMDEIKLGLAEVATVQMEFSEELKTLNKSR